MAAPISKAASTRSCSTTFAANPRAVASSYLHPRLMPDFWQYPTVSMGLGPLTAAYQARYMRYLEYRELKPHQGRKVWAFLGDGEMDQPESLAAIALGGRENSIT